MKRDPDRERRHDEKWQAEVLDGMTRMLAVLHDLSDGIRDLGETMKRVEQKEPAAAPATTGDPSMMSVVDLATLIGSTPATVYAQRHRGTGPPGIKVGRRVMFRRIDVETWLLKRRDPDTTAGGSWRDNPVWKQVGAGLPRSTAPPSPQPWCTGSHTEPLRASKYRGLAVCRECRGGVSVNRDGKLRKHRPSSFPEL